MRGGHSFVKKSSNGDGTHLFTCQLCQRSFICRDPAELPGTSCASHVIDPAADLGLVALTKTLPFHHKHGMFEGVRLRVVDDRAGELWVMGAADIPIKLQEREFRFVEESAEAPSRR